MVLVLLVGTLIWSATTMSGLNGRAHQLAARDTTAINALGDLRNGIATMRSALGDTLQPATPAPVKASAAGAVTTYGSWGPLMVTFTNSAAALAAKRMKSAQSDAAAAASAYSNARVILLVMALLCIGLGGGIALLLSRRITSGVKQLMAAANGIAEGDVQQSVTVSSKDELGATANAFGRMISYLEEMARTADEVADGNLTVQARPRSERDLLGKSFARLISRLGAAIGDVSAQRTPSTRLRSGWSPPPRRPAGRRARSPRR